MLVSLGVACADAKDPQGSVEETMARLSRDGGARAEDIAADEVSDPSKGNTIDSHAALDGVDTVKRSDAGPSREDAGPAVATASADTNLNHQDAGSSVPDDVDVDVGLFAFDAGTMTAQAKNVIFLIADGYGATAMDATRIFVNGDTAPLSFEKLPHTAWVSTNNARNQVTESAAGATALATGHKVDESVLSIALPGDGADLKTALEVQQARGKRTGIVTTHTSIADATPAGFAAHAANRGDTNRITTSYFTQTRPNVMFGLIDAGINASVAQSAGYTVVENATQLASLDLDTEHHVSGQFTENTVPPLKDMALAAINILEDAPEGFFIVIEQEETDSANHNNDLPRMLNGAVEFNETVAAVMAWAKGRHDTLIVVGTDHETGGLVLSEDNPTAGVVPRHSYSTMGHTGADVRFFAGGVGASQLAGNIENTDVFPLLAGYDATRVATASVKDIALHEGSPSTASATGDTLEADFEPGLTDQSLLRIDHLAGYLPLGCTFQAAKLILHGTKESADGIRLHRMLQPWSSASTWDSFGGNGVQTNDVEAAADVSAQSNAFITGVNTFDVTATVAAWLADPTTNHGWVILGKGNDDAQFTSSESTAAPELRLYCD